MEKEIVRSSTSFTSLQVFLFNVSFMNTDFHYLTQDETKRLLAAISSKRDQAIFLTAYRHGLRASEIGMLHQTDVDLKRGRITIRRLKGSLSGTYPLQPDEQKVIRSCIC